MRTRSPVPAIAAACLLSACAVQMHAQQPPAADRHPGRFVKYEPFPARAVAPREVVVWLPDDYDTASRRYAVLYMHDGRNLFDPRTSMGGEPWAVDRHVAELIKSGAIRDTLIVGIDNAASNRWREYAPAAALEPLPGAIRDKLANDNGGSLLGDDYLRFLVSELKPFIDSHYRTLPEREATFIMGSSMGGLISLYALARYPEVFGGAGCLSTHWPIATSPDLLQAPADPRSEAIAAAYFNWLESNLPPAGRHRLYFDHGTEFLDALYRPLQVKVDALLLAKGYSRGVDFMSEVYPGATHNEAAWRARLEVPLGFLLRR